MIDYRRLQSDLVALALFAACLFLALSLISFRAADAPSGLVYPAAEQPVNWCGPIGAAVAFTLMNLFGHGSYLILAGLIVFDLKLFSDRPFQDTFLRAAGIGLLVFSLATTLRLLAPGLGEVGLHGSGGKLGASGADMLREHFSIAGTALVLMTLALAGLMLSAEVFALALLRKCFWVPFVLLHSKVRPLKPTDQELELEREYVINAPLCQSVPDPEPELALLTQKKTLLNSPTEKEPVEEAKQPPQPPVLPPALAAFRVNPPATAPLPANQYEAEEEEHDEWQQAPPERIPFELPGLDLLEGAEEFPYELLAKRAKLAAVTLERTFQEFNLNIKVVEIDTGPVVTQFELELEPGLRVSKVTALADDLAIALRVPAVRIVSSIPGKNTVGVEVPNDKRVMVRMRELMEACRSEAEKMRLPLFLGKDVSGHPMTVDLAKMPHLLIAGRTGTGKSVCLNTLILSLLMTRSPEQVKMLMIDPKMVELSPYTKIPHLMHPVITDMKKAEAVLQWAVDKMEERYDLLARTGVRHLESYNNLGHSEVLRRLGVAEGSEDAEQIPEKMPYIVIVADEMADMIMTSGKEVEAHIIRLAQKSRAVGIHLVLATQKPTVDVITGLIKSNLPARIAFQVASRTDSRVVLDEMGAERLLGNGDMLYLAPGTSHLTRSQGTFVSDQEVTNVIEFLGQHEPQYSQEISQATSNTSGGVQRGIEAIKERDELYEQAIDVVIREGRGSVSLLQRALGIGYGRGARLIDYMAEDGIVGDYNGSQAREVLYTPEQWAALRNGEVLEEMEV